MSTPTAAAPIRRLLFVLDAEAGHVTAHVRGRLLAEPLAARGIEVQYRDARLDPPLSIAEAASQADAVFLVKVPSLAVHRLVRAHTSGPVLFDFTDALWLPHHAAYGWQDLECLLREADVVLCDNPFIAAYAQARNPAVALWLTATRLDLMDAARARRDQEAPALGRPVRIGWVGSRGTANAVSTLVPVLEAVAARVPGCELRLVGCEATVLPPIDGLVVSARPQYDEAAMIDELMAMDLGVFPAPVSLEDYQNRGGLKGAIYMSAGLPAVCQRGGELDAVIASGVNGILADGVDEWTQALIDLITSPTRREVMGRAARAAMADRSLDAVTDRLLAIITDAVAHRRVAADDSGSSLATHLDGVEEALSRGDLAGAVHHADALVRLDPTNADFRTLRAQLR
jgi:glycosyltransferase involved in cell wall biosynthesis